MNRKVLVADDNQAIRRSIEFALVDAGYTVITAENGEDALAKAVSERPDLVILDLIMPRMNGFEVLRQLQDQPETKSLPVIVFSDLAQEVDLHPVLKSGAVAFFVKSNYSVTDIIEKVRHYVGAAA